MLVKCAGADTKLKITVFAPSDEVSPPWSCCARSLFVCSRCVTHRMTLMLPPSQLAFNCAIGLLLTLCHHFHQPGCARLFKDNWPDHS